MSASRVKFGMLSSSYESYDSYDSYELSLMVRDVMNERRHWKGLGDGGETGRTGGLEVW